MGELLTIEQAAQRAQMSRNTLLKYIKSGDLPVAVFSSRLKRIRAEALDAFVRKFEGTPSSQDLSASITPKTEVVEMIRGRRR